MLAYDHNIIKLTAPGVLGIRQIMATRGTQTFAFFLYRNRVRKNWPDDEDEPAFNGSVLPESVVVELALTDDIEIGELGWIIHEDADVFVVVVVVVVVVTEAATAVVVVVVVVVVVRVVLNASLV